MATRKNELLEQENQTREMPESADNSMSISDSVSEAEENAMPAVNDGESEQDLNELLGSMDQEVSETDTPGAAESETSAEGTESSEKSESTVAEAPSEPMDGAEESIATENPPAKPKRTARKKKTTEAPAPEQELPASEESVPGMAEEPVVSGEEAALLLEEPKSEPHPSAPSDMPPVPAGRDVPVRSNAPVLTIRNREDVTTEAEQEDITWHEIRNAYRTRRILTGKLGGIEQTDNKKTIAIVDYKGFRIIIPLKEMMIQLPDTSTEQEYSELMLRQNKILNNMLGADIDFIVRGIDSKTYSVVASRREAMLRKRQLFYLDTDASGMYRVYEGRVVQARVIAVAEKVIRVEVFGVETSIMARDLAWDWIGDAHERFSVGDEVLVRVQKVRRETPEDIGIKVDIKSISQNTSQDNLQKCRIQSKYMGKVTDIHKGVVYIRLSNGVNAIAHSCYDYRTPGKKDDISFAVTRLDVERGVAVGIITRIIRQNL